MSAQFSTQLSSVHIPQSRILRPLLITEPMFTDSYNIVSSQYSSANTARVDKCAVSTVEISENTPAVCFDQLRMMSTDEFAINSNVTVRAATDSD